MVKKTYLSPFILAVFDFFLLNISFFGMNYWKRGTLELSPLYVKLLIAFYVIWLFVSLLTKKFQFDFSRGYPYSIYQLTRLNIYIAYCIALMVVLMGLYGFSRLQVFGTCGLFFAGELISFSFYYVMIHRAKTAYAGTDSAKPKPKHLIVLSVSDFLLVTSIFFIVNYFKRGTFVLSPEYEKLLLIIYALWFVTAFITRKFDSGFRNYYYAMAQWTKAVVFMVTTMAVLVFMFKLFYYSRSQIFGFCAILILTEAVLYYVYFVLSSNEKNGGDIESVGEIMAIIKQDTLILDLDINDIQSRLIRPIGIKLQEKYLKDYPWLYNFIDQSLNLSEIFRVETTIINSDAMFHMQTIDDRSTRLFINLHKVNDIRWINRYFLEVYDVLLNGGYFVGKVHTISTHRKWFFKKYPKYFAEILYFIEFIFHRISPKLPIIKRIYFSLTKGKNRMISKAELLGRLNFCGFKIIAEKEIEGRLCFIVQKVKTPSIDESPSYSPLVKFKRVGQNGQILHVYKFRTMHPYSEYLQEYIYETNGTQKSGDKFLNDFRITFWGKYLRKLWIDELPMIYNLIAGDIKLVGVRPLSQQKYNIYKVALQKRRIKHKPGLIPPFYADLPETFEGLMESENKYIDLYEKQPLRTDIRYFFKALYNIIVKNARSQ